jgi:hypothetical protein
MTPSLPPTRTARHIFSTAHRSLGLTNQTKNTHPKPRGKRENQKKTRNQFQRSSPIPVYSEATTCLARHNSTGLAVVRANQPNPTHPPTRGEIQTPERASTDGRGEQGGPSLTRADAGVGRPPEPHLLDDEAGPDEGARRHREDQALGVVRRHAPAAPGRRR